MAHKDKEDQDNSTRRNFLKKGLLVSGGAVLAGGVTKAVTNRHESGEKIKALTSDGRVVEVDCSHLHEVKPEKAGDNKLMRKGVPDRKFVMVIDLSRCKNERKCQKGCREMHNLPEDVNWLKILKMKDAKTTAPYWMPSLCFHCDNPPCVKVCPVDATFKREDGVVLIDNERCIGCRFCMAACPYSARSFNWSEPEIPEGTEMDNHNHHHMMDRKKGTVDKCDFCAHDLKDGKLPKCVSSCPNGVFYMGDLNEDTVTNGDETIRFSELIKNKAGYRFLEELGTKPNVYYLPAANRLFPFEEDKS